MTTCEYVWESETVGWIAFCVMVSAVAWAYAYKNKGRRDD